MGFIKHIKDTKIPLNQILYGPPGTGKTYNTIDKALEILYDYELIDFIPQERGDKKVLFDEFIEQGQISFVTFHQSYGYEDFVEGIRPRLSGGNDEGQISEKMEYEIRDGIFKQMCKEASKNYEKSLKNISEVKQEIELDDLLEQYATYIEDELKEGKEPKFESKEWTTKMKIQGVHRLQNGDFSSIVIGVSNDSSSMQRLSQKVIKRDYEKFKSGEIKDWNDIKPSYESKSHRHGNAGYYFTLYESIAEFEKTHYQTSTIPSLESTLDNRLKPYILIIDEINRGNISKILGELITLLESSKRKDEEEALEVILPYSQKPFSVPNNLYIIGTMNTADRSIALLDTALRRRFEFIEMMPDSSLLSTDCDGVDLQRLLESINNRIEFLLDRERSVGHAFLIDVKNLSDLKAVFKNKILPLLQEYFYDDYAKINAVLNNNGMLESTTISHMKSLDEFIDGEKKVWRITDSSKWDIETFKAMYKNTESN
ncbi:MAG: AAA family ATPase [Helicobacter sp.]|nr:AAA family ATPase [Helicobacter sp.]